MAFRRTREPGFCLRERPAVYFEIAKLCVVIMVLITTLAGFGGCLQPQCPGVLNLFTGTFDVPGFRSGGP